VKKITNTTATVAETQTSTNAQNGAIRTQKKIAWSLRFSKIKLEKEQRIKYLENSYADLS